MSITIGCSLEILLTSNNSIYTGGGALAEPSGRLLELGKRYWVEPVSNGFFICL
jgi:hypothetical protein